MGEYWWKAITEAWKATKHSFGYNSKTIATALVIAGGGLITLANAGLPSVMTSLGTYFWYGVPIGFAGLILFIWNFIQVQAAMYATVHSKLRELEIRFVTPDLSAWRYRSDFTLCEAAYLFADIPPQEHIIAGGSASAWFGALESEIDSGQLQRIRGDLDDNHYVLRGKYRAHSGTKIGRDQLQKFADERGVKPFFLSSD